MYIDEMKYVLNCLNGKQNNLLTLKEGIETLDVSIAIKNSGKKNIPISI